MFSDKGLNYVSLLGGKATIRKISYDSGSRAVRSNTRVLPAILASNSPSCTLCPDSGLPSFNNPSPSGDSVVSLRPDSCLARSIQPPYPPGPLIEAAPDPYSDNPRRTLGSCQRGFSDVGSDDKTALSGMDNGESRDRDRDSSRSQADQSASALDATQSTGASLAGFSSSRETTVPSAQSGALASVASPAALTQTAPHNAMGPMPHQLGMQPYVAPVIHPMQMGYGPQSSHMGLSSSQNMGYGSQGMGYQQLGYPMGMGYHTQFQPVPQILQTQFQDQQAQLHTQTQSNRVRTHTSHQRDRRPSTPQCESVSHPERDSASPSSSYEDTRGEDEDREDKEEEETPAPHLLSMDEAISFLSDYDPEAVTVRQSTVPRICSAADRLWGQATSRSDGATILKESPIVSQALEAALAKARDPKKTNKNRASHSSADEVPDFPGAFKCGSFPRPVRSPFTDKYLELVNLPDTSPRLSQQDTLLLPFKERNRPLKASLSSKTLEDWSEGARRGLESVSVVDSFLGGLMRCMLDPEKEFRSLRDPSDICPQAIMSFIKSISEALKFSAATQADLLVGLNLARRDAILGASKIVKDHQTRRSLRVVDLTSGSLFGNHVKPLIKESAERNRDLIMANADNVHRSGGGQKRHAPDSQPSQGGSQEKYRKHLGRQSDQQKQNPKGSEKGKPQFQKKPKGRKTQGF